MIHEAIETPAAEATGLVLHVERDALHDALQLLCRIVERRNTIPILSYLLFEPLADASGVAITATDLDLQLTLNVRYNSAPEGGGRFCVPAFTLADMVKKAEKGAHLELTLRDGRLEMMHGRTRGKLTPLPADDFPLMVAAKEGETPVAFTLPAEQFAGDLARVAWAQGKEETRYYLLGTALQMREGAFTMAATDGHNLAWIDRALGCEAFPDVILPRKAGDMIRRIVKGRAPAELELAITESRIVAGTQGLCLVSKAIDGSFPDWRKVPDGLPAELQLVAMPEIEPRMPLPAVEMCAKAIGGSPIVEMGTDCVRLTLPAAPEFTAIAMMLKADALPKGYAYEANRDGHEQARGYLRDLATAADLPLFHSEYTDHEQKVRQREETRLIIVDGLILGACFGEQTSHAGKDHEYVEEPDYETLTMRTVKREVMRSDAWQDGAYCVAMPRERAGMAAAVTMGTPGVDERAVATKNDAILLDAKAIAALAGDPAEWVRVEIKPYPMHHGRRLPDGFVVPFAPLTQQPDAKGRSKLRHMSDREVTRAYCEDPAGLMAKLQPQPTPAATVAVEAIVEIARLLSGPAPAEQPGATETEMPADLSTAPLSAETDAPAETAQMPVEVAQEEPATPEPQRPEIAPDAPQAAPEVPIEPDGGGLATQFAALLARIEVLESRLEAAENVRRTEPEAENGASEAEQLPADNNLTRARRLRIVRWYLTLRKQRQQLRAGIAAECARAEDAEFRASDLTHQLEQAQARLAEETARADSADGRWQIVLDSKQARIVALENDLLERLSGGRVKLTPPLRANATPLWPAANGRMQ